MAMKRSGQITVATIGTAVQGPDVSALNFLPDKLFTFELAAHPDNTKTVWVGNDGAGDITKDNAYPLKPGSTIVVQDVDLNQLWFDSEVNGEKVCWLVAAG